ncbi:AbrB/MazE/SpoVT family DNA-binding domain-containing protein (plasmid) [Haloarcula sp. NS06]|uniref:AbrB/MazE/SpoVT family DNA-binding domain-containing protein n=1 Tax=Haloarcula sp. NS06 TaxID=3409688 RepID=UPI003DA6FA19
MVKVDSKGRIVLPKKVREDLGITPGTEVTIRGEDGKAVVEPKENPEQIIERAEQFITQMSSEHGETKPPEEGVDPISQKHRDVIRRGAEENSDE